MTEKTADLGDATDPNFEFHHDVIREDNWTEYEARGFTPDAGRRVINQRDILREVQVSRGVFGLHNVYTGDAWDDEAGRPLRHKPGKSVYIDVQGRLADKKASSHQSDSDPAAS
jgi:hypothetical protein